RAASIDRAAPHQFRALPLPGRRRSPRRRERSRTAAGTALAIALRMSFRTVLFALGAVIVASAVVAAPDPPRKIPAAPKDFALNGDAKRGEPTFVQYCASCHGKHGDGKGIVGKTLTPPPADLNDSVKMAAVSDWELYLAIASGGASVDLSAVMPAWSSALKEQE